MVTVITPSTYPQTIRPESPHLCGSTPPMLLLFTQVKVPPTFHAHVFHGNFYTLDLFLRQRDITRSEILLHPVDFTRPWDRDDVRSESRHPREGELGGGNPFLLGDGREGVDYLLIMRYGLGGPGKRSGMLPGRSVGRGVGEWKPTVTYFILESSVRNSHIAFGQILLLQLAR